MCLDRVTVLGRSVRVAGEIALKHLGVGRAHGELIVLCLLLSLHFGIHMEQHSAYYSREDDA